MYNSADFKTRFPFMNTMGMRGNRIVVHSQAGVHLVDTEGNLLATVGERGQGPGKFVFPRAVAINHKGEIVVSDGDKKSCKIIIYDSAGKFLWEFGEFGTGDGKLEYPHALAFDSQDRFYVIDGQTTPNPAITSQVQIFSPEGEYLHTFSRIGKVYQAGLAVCPETGRIFFLTNPLSVFSPFAG